MVTLDNGEKRWVAFKYERLPNLCYWCGKLNHDDKSCERWIQSKGTLPVSEQQFGPYLRAAPYRAAGKGVIYVPGYYERDSTRSTGSGTTETRTDGKRTASSAEGSSADVVHRDVTSVTNSEVNHSSIQPSLTQLDLVSMPTIIEELMLPKSTPIINESNTITGHSISVEEIKQDTFLAKIKENNEALLARTFNPNMASTNQLAQKRMITAINSIDKEKIPLSANGVTDPTRVNDAEVTALLKPLPPQEQRKAGQIGGTTKSVWEEKQVQKQATWKRIGNRLSTEADISIPVGVQSKKRSIESTEITNGLPCKKRGVAVGDEVAISGVAEAEHQPCQSQ